MDTAAIDWLTELVLQADAREHPIAPSALGLLLRRYAATGREDLRAALGRGLARGLDALASPSAVASQSAVGPTFRSGVHDIGGRSGVSDNDAPAWLALFAETATLSEDERLPAAVLTLVTSLQRAWPSRETVACAMRSVDASLAAARVLDHAHAQEVIRAAIDELERVVGLVYRPGEAIAHSLRQPEEADGDLQDHVWAASALVTAHAITGRLPYSMLAEELMQCSRRRWWDEGAGSWKSEVGSLNADGSLNAAGFAMQCHAARVLCGLAALHRDDDYRQAAVVAPQSTYASDAERSLASLSSAYREYGIEAAVYGLALDEWFDLHLR